MAGFIRTVFSKLRFGARLYSTCIPEEGLEYEKYPISRFVERIDGGDEMIRPRELLVDFHREKSFGEICRRLKAARWANKGLEYTNFAREMVPEIGNAKFRFKKGSLVSDKQMLRSIASAKHNANSKEVIVFFTGTLYNNFHCKIYILILHLYHWYLLPDTKHNALCRGNWIYRHGVLTASCY